MSFNWKSPISLQSKPKDAQFYARLNADEFTAFKQVMQQAARKAEAPVTRTKVVIAALTVATRAEATPG